MADRRRRSPEGSSSRRKEKERSEFDEPLPRRSSIAGSSSSSSSYIDISRTYPRKISGIISFFTAPSERRRLRRRRSAKFFKLNNGSSSSSINEDLAYGTGFVKSRQLRRVRSRKGKEIDREKERDRYKGVERPATERRPTTDAEILAVGAGLAKLAREQNKLDLKAARGGKRPELVAVRETGRADRGTARGLGPSKGSHGPDSFDEDGWESASGGESELSVDSKLAFGGDSQAGWGFWGKKVRGPMSRKSSVVDPRLFGRQNSLKGIVTQPVGFGDVTWTSTTDFGQPPYFPAGSTGPVGNTSDSQAPLQRVYPVPTSDPSRFEAARSSVVSGSEPYISSRPGPIVLQQPQPVTPVSQSVYDPIYATSPNPSIVKRTPSSSGRGKSVAEAALVGIAGAAVGAAITSDRKDDRKERRREEVRDIRDEDRPSKRRDEVRDSRDEERSSKRRDEAKDARDDDRSSKRRESDRKENKDERRRDERSSVGGRDEKKDRRRDKDRKKDDSRYSVDEPRREKDRDKRREKSYEEERDEKHEKRREEKRTERPSTDRRYNSENAVATTAVDPFQYQVRDDDFPTPPAVEGSSSYRRKESVPTVVTVEREPNFARNRSSSIKDGSSYRPEPRREYAEYDDRDQRYRDHDSRDRALHDAESIYRETEHSTAPIEAAAIGAAVAAVTAERYRESRSEKRRDERRGGQRDRYDDDDYKPRHKGASSDPERDAIQEEADRAYREIVMARKIASQVIRSRTPSPDRSVVDKFAKEEEEVIRIVTPPGMEDHKKKGPYDAPNADFQLDHVLIPTQLPTFNIPSISLDHSNRETLPLKKDPDAIQPRPFLNLVQPTPTPSPHPEKQIARSQQAKSTRSTDRDEPTGYSASDVVIGPKGNVVVSPSASPVIKAVTWGENETKHFEVESPGDHRDEFVSREDVRARESPSDSKPTTKKKSGGWGAIAAGIVGASAGAGAAAAAAAKSSEDSKRTRSEISQKIDSQVGGPYEYRGVVVEPESPPRSQKRHTPPPTGTKPSLPQQSRVPGGFDDDLDFTATVAAGLQDTGFDPNIVINDSSFRRRSSPPGSNESHGIYQAPYAETVTDLGPVLPSTFQPVASDRGFVVDEVAEAPKDWRSTSPDNDFSTPLSKKEQKKREKAKRTQSDDTETPYQEYATPREAPEDYFTEPKLSKKEQKKRDKAAQRQSSQAEDTTPFDDPSTGAEIVEEPESYFETPKKSKKKSKKGSSTFDDDAQDASPDSRRISVPVDTFDDLRNGEDEWNETKKSKKKSKRDSERYDSPSQTTQSEIAQELERSSSKKSKDKSKRKSEQYEPAPTEVPLPASTQSEISRDDGYEEPKKVKKSSRDSDLFDTSASRSVVSESAARYDDDDPHKSKKKSRSGRDDDDTRSVTSAPVGDDFEDIKKSKKKDKRGSGSFFGLFGSKSDSGAKDDSPKSSKDDYEDTKKKSKKSKRSSVSEASGIYADTGAQSVNDLTRSTSAENGNGHYEDDRDNGTLSDDDRTKKDSFLGNAGTLGAGAGLAGAAVAIAAQYHRQSKAANATETVADSSSRWQHEDPILDPEIIPRQVRPSIDPQYGDFLPLPPSDPNSPNAEPVDDLPELPESRPDTPEAERLARERSQVAARRAFHETPVKSPSHSAVPLKFLMGNRSLPSSPGIIRSPPAQSPATPSPDSLAFPKSRPRPTSWDSTKEYKPLYLVESNRRGSLIEQHEPEEELPALPPSQRSSRSSSQLTLNDAVKGERGEQPADVQRVRFADPLSIDTALAAASSHEDLLDSQQSTPKAGIHPQHTDDVEETIHEEHHDGLSDLPALPSSRSTSQEPEDHSGSHNHAIPKSIAAAALASSIGYFASSPSHRVTKSSWIDDLPSRDPIQRQPSPVDPMTKDRSSYLLQSSPMPRKYDDESSDNLAKNHERPYHADEDTLHSIDETDTSDIFEDTNEFPEEHVDAEREKTLATLSGPSAVEHTTGLKEGQVLEEEHMISPEDPEPAHEFSLTNFPKKDKKNGKKTAKGLSRSSTFDDRPPPETSRDIIEPALLGATVLAGAALAVEEYSTSKSKKDKKAKKGKSVATRDVEVEEEEMSQPQPALSAENNRGIIDASTPSKNEAAEEFTVPKSKKDKKKDKKKGKSVDSWEPEVKAAAEPDFSEPSHERSRNILDEVATPVEIELVEESALPKSKKDKKGKKKGKSIDAWEPERQEIVADSTPEQVARDLEPESQEVQTPVGAELVEESSLPRSNTDKKAKKGRSDPLLEPEIHNIVRETPKSQLQEAVDASVTGREDHPSIAKDTPLPQFSIERPITPAETQDPLAVEATIHTTSESLPAFAQIAQALEANEATKSIEPRDLQAETNIALVEESLHAADADPIEDFSILTSKKSKTKKGKSAATWQEDSEAMPETPSETFATPSGGDDNVEEFLTPLETGSNVEYFSSKLSKKDKKGKKRNQLDAIDESAATPPQEVLPTESLEAVPTETPNPDDVDVTEEFFTTKSKKGKKKDKKGKAAAAWESQQDEEPAQDAAREFSQDVISEPNPESQIAPVLQEQEPEIAEVFVLSGSKKNKKKGKKAQAWTFDDDAPSEPLSEANIAAIATGEPRTAEPAPARQVDVESEPSSVRGSKKSKNKLKNSLALDLEPSNSPQEQTRDRSLEVVAERADPGTTQSGEGLGDFIPPSKKSKKKSRNSQAWTADDDVLTEEMQATPETKTTEPELVEIAEDHKLEHEAHLQPKTRSMEDGATFQDAKSSSKPTPIGGPGAWPITPATPWVGAGNETLESAHTDYFPSAAVLHSPLTRQPSSESKSKGYFPSAAGLLPIAAAAAIFGVNPAKKTKPSDPAPADVEPVSKFDAQERQVSEVVAEPSKPTHDGLAAGNDSEQLSLARRLQEEFSAGTKKLKKDKKNRRSLPATPVPEESRSRPQDEVENSQPRARSLSIGPAALAGGTSSADRGNLYSQDQLELARQLREEFGPGSKKSKKDKKKRGEFSQPSKQDALSPGEPSEALRILSAEPEIVSEPGLNESSLKGDGFAAGYQEDQLSLARQLQAEFGSGKKSKKDKKRRSTSQTPAQEPEPRNDYFGDFDAGSHAEKQRTVTESAVPSPQEQGTSRDGLAAGYKEDQLELARQLKEEFGSGALKSKKDKKGKKRQSLLRTTTDDGFSPESGLPAAEPRGTEEAGSMEQSDPNEVVTPAMEDDWAAPSTKKSKKGKKKNRESLALGTQDDSDSPSDFGRDVEALHNARDLQLTDGDTEPVPAGDELAHLSKEDDLRSRQVEPVDTIANTSEASTDPQEDYGLATKKSKKDKKKRQSLLRTSSIPGDSEEKAEEANEPSTSQTQDLSRELESATTLPVLWQEQDAGWDFTTKKSKKDKKRAQSLAETSMAWEAPSSTVEPAKSANFPAAQKPGGNVPRDARTFSQVPDEPPLIESIIGDATITPADIEAKEATPEDSFEEHALTRKPSKKDKKKSKGLSISQSDDQSTAPKPVEPLSEPAKHIAKITHEIPHLEREGVISEHPQIQKLEPTVQSGLSADHSLARDEGSAAETLPAQDQHETTAKDITEEPDEEWGSFAIKKSKKDKKKKQTSGLATPLEEALPIVAAAAVVEHALHGETSKNKPHPDNFDEETAVEAKKDVETPSDDWGFAVTKKSKKGKGKRTSGVSTPAEEPPAVAEPAVPEGNLLESVIPKDEPLPRDVVETTPKSLKQSTEEPVEEWGSISTKKSKRDKKKRVSEPSTPMEEKAETLNRGPSAQPSDQSALDEPMAGALDPIPDLQKDDIEEPVDDWGAFATKKSKKDKKKRKSGPSTPLEETTNTSKPDLDSTVVLDESAIQEPPFERENERSTTAVPGRAVDEGDDWSSAATKSTKDKKKRNSGLSSMIKDSLGAAVLAVVPSTILGATEKRHEETHDDQTNNLVAEAQPAEDGNDWSTSATKMNKKDKKKQESGVSALAKETIVDPSTSSTNAVERTIDVEEPQSQDSIEVEALASREIVTEPADEWSSFALKPSKKDKKKRKSGLSTPLATFGEEAAAVITTETRTEREVLDEPSLHSTVSQERSSDAQPEENFSLPNETPQNMDDEPFAFVAKKSKKDKKGKGGKKSSQSESDISPKGSTPPLAAVADDPAIEDLPVLASERFSSPIPLEEITELGGVQAIHEPEASRGSNVVIQPIEADDTAGYPTSLSRKASKDKRKRRETIDLTAAGEPTAVKKPPTTWADEVEEAEVERSLPVIEDIAQDESLSRIPSTTEAISADDFIRPAKKGKKGKKRDSGRFESKEEASISDAPADSLPKAAQGSKAWLPGVATLGSVAAVAATTGASLIGKLGGAGKKAASPESTEEMDLSLSTNALESELGKKELRKKEKGRSSMKGRSATQEDIFDDPALWESAEPTPFEEARQEPEEDGSDGFWSAPREEDESQRQPELEEEIRSGAKDAARAEARHEEHAAARSASPIEATTAGHASARLPEDTDVAGQSSKGAASTQQRDTPLLSDDQQIHLSRPDEQWNDVPDEFIVAPSKKDKKKKKQSRFSPAWEIPLETDRGSEMEVPPSHLHHGEVRSSSELEHVREVPLLDPLPTPNDEPFYTPLEEPAYEALINRGVAFEDTPTEYSSPFSGSRYNRQSTPALPVLREESPEFEPASHSMETPPEINRDSAFVTGSPVPPPSTFADNHEHVRDSGVHLRESSPAEHSRAPVSSTDDALARLSWPVVDEEAETVDLHKQQRPGLPSGTTHHSDRGMDDRIQHRHSPPSHSTTESPRPHHLKEYSKVQRSHWPLSPRALESDASHYPRERSPNGHHRAEVPDLLPSQRTKDARPTELHRTQTIHRSERRNGESLVKQRVERIESPDFHRSERPKSDKYTELKETPRPKAETPRGHNDSHLAAGAAIAAGAMGFAAARQLSSEKRPSSAQSQRSASNMNRLRTPEHRPDSVNSNRSSGTPPLRRSDRKLSGDLRSLSQRSKVDLAKEAELAALSSSAPTTTAPPPNPNPTANEGRVRVKDMADVYDGFGEGRMGSPRSPTRPHSMRRRQSMQVLELESRLDQLAAENRMLAEARAQAEHNLQSSQHASLTLVERDAEIDSLKRSLEWLQNEVTRLTEVNEGLNSANTTLAHQHNDRYNQLEARHGQATRELQEIHDVNNNLSAGMEGIVKNEVQTAVQSKDQEIAELRAQLNSAQEQIREMQRQILMAKANDSDFLTVRDEDYFDNACQTLCQHVQQWVLRFSKFSDMRACRLTSEINNDKIIDRLDNAILDGSDVDTYLADRIKRRDVFMSMTMTMVWEFVFTRYLFGMDREQRQKLKSLEKLLSEVGPAAAVHHWRATTLTLLSKREAFVQQREQDTLAVVNAIMETLTEILPPPSHLEDQIQEQLTRVMKAAVDLSIEMRTQRAEYMMLPPLQPEYDANGDLASKVMFNAALMNERSGDTVSNEELEAQRAVVRIVLFPLVVKKGDDRGEGDEEIVVCPAQVLVAKPPGKKQVRVFSPDSAAGQSRMSLQSSMPAGEGGEGNVI